MKTKEIFEGRYVIYSDGRVWSNYQNKFLKQHLNKRGYLTVSIGKDYKFKTAFIHKLVAEAFIPNPNNFKIANHKDRNKTNNNVENLEWCTHRYNITHGFNNKFPGTAWNNHNKGWQATVRHNGKRQFLGYYKTQEEAYDVYMSYLILHNLI